MRIITLMVLLTTLLVGGSRPVAAVQAKPPTIWSFYVKSNSVMTAKTLGCNQANHDGTYNSNSMVILDFGAQDVVGGVSGTRITGLNTFISNTSIQSYVQEFAKGYWECRDTTYSTITRVGMGTNNSKPVGGVDRVNFGGGRNWAQLVTSIRTQVAVQGWSSRVLVYGANDMEPDFSGTSAQTRDWLNGFDYEVSPPIYQINFGAASGCPEYSSSNGSCLNSWKQDDIWYLSYGPTVALALPQIYVNRTNPTQARQWAMISLYGAVSKSRKIFFEGPTDSAWFSPNPPWNTSIDAWNQLWTEINRDSRTASNLKYSVQWHNSN